MTATTARVPALVILAAALAAASGSPAAEQALFENRHVTPSGEYTSGIEGPAVDAGGNLLVANASAATVTGGSALALASLVAEQSPLLTQRERDVMARMLAGSLDFAFPASQKIVVQADAVSCRSSNVDIASRSCELTFGSTRVSLKGRQAHELFATIGEIGVPPEGAAGSIYESISHLMCTIEPNEVKERAGGGAACSFDQGTL
jgi:hypothetical protein